MGAKLESYENYLDKPGFGNEDRKTDTGPMQEHLAENKSVSPTVDRMLLDAHIEMIKNCQVMDDEGRVWDQEEMREVKPLHDAKERHAERGARDRRLLQGRAIREPGKAQVGPNKFEEGFKWKDGYLVERPWIEDAAFAASARQQNAFQKAENAWHAAKRPMDSWGEIEVDASGARIGYVEAPAGVSAPKPATGFAVASTRRRVAIADLPQRRTLLALAGAIRDALARKDTKAAGEFLLEAQPIVGRGKFVEWVRRETGLPERTARRYMASIDVPRIQNGQS